MNRLSFLNYAYYTSNSEGYKNVSCADKNEISQD